MKILKKYCGLTLLCSMPLVVRQNMKQTAVVTILLLSFLAAANADEGLQILSKAEKTMGALTFVAECKWQDGLKVIVTQKPGKEGVCLNKRELVVMVEGVPMTNQFLMNQSGVWQILPTQALRMDFLKISGTSPLYGLVENGLNLSIPAIYSVVSNRVDGRDMIVVTQVPTDPGAENHPVRTTILVGQADDLVYGYSAESRDGSISKMSVTDFKILSDLPDEVFEVPASDETIICTNAMVHHKVIAKIDSDFVRSPGFKASAKHFERKSKAVRYVLMAFTAVPLFLLLIYYRSFRSK